ncbi:MAG: alkaline phosphatase D family protein [Verrucomicrobiota bacterium]
MYPFSLGIACGDPTPTGIVLWTRLAPDPLAPGGGMPQRPVEVSFQIAKDEAMSRVVASGTATAGPQWAHSVHVEVEGLQPDSWYWYQFKFRGEVSPKGRARTLPLPSVMPEKLRFAFASCQNYQFGYYTAFDHLAQESPDLVVHLGDYIYESGSRKEGMSIRSHQSGACMTLDDYRVRYALYKSDPLLQRAHEVAPWIVTWDDHEFANNCNGIIPGKPMVAREFLSRRAAAYQAYFEHMPLRRASLPSGPDLLLYRDFNFGKLASFQVLDTRQYRSVQVGGEKVLPQGKAALSSKRSILGETQKKWLFDSLSTSPCSWNVLAQQVMFARVDMTRGEEKGYNMDKWAGYENDRRQLIRHLQQNKIANPVVITGDIHSNWASEIPNDFDGAKATDVAVELVGTSISSSGDGQDKPKRNSWLFNENPHVKFHNNERGYVMCEVTPTLWRADFRTVEYITRAGAPRQTRASYVVEAGAPKLVRA